MPKERVRCRPVDTADLPAIAALLAQGFRGRKTQEIASGLSGLADRAIPRGAQRYGYCLDTGGRIVGAVVLIASERVIDGKPAVFCNISNWYVLPEYRSYAQLLISIALRNREFTYLNVSPAPHTWPIVENQGYTRYCEGLFFLMAALERPDPAVRVEEFSHDRHAKMPDAALLERHQAMGCTVLVLRRGEASTGLVLRRYRIRGGRLALPAMFVIHASDRTELLASAGNVGRYLIKRAAPVLVMDADGPEPGHIGMFTARRGRKYFKGPHRPALCDLADTEYAYFGL